MGRNFLKDKGKQHKTTTRSAYLEGSSVALKDRHRRKTTNEGENTHQKLKNHLKNPKKNNMQAKKPYSSTGLRHIFAIVSSQISTVMEPSITDGTNQSAIGNQPT